MNFGNPGSLNELNQEGGNLELGIRGKIAIVTGGSRGIGRAVCEELLAEGCKVATCSRHIEDFADLQAHDPSNQLYVQYADTTDPDSIKEFVEYVKQRFGRVDILVNNAGKAYPGTFKTLTDEDWHADINVKLMAYIRFSRAVLPLMPKGGKIINITAVFGKQPDARFFASSTNRAACISMTKALAKELASDEILVNGINIGFVHSGQWESRPKEFFHDMICKFEVPLQRFGNPEEVSAVVAFLASVRSSYVTGTIIDVDGGMAKYL